MKKLFMIVMTTMFLTACLSPGPIQKEGLNRKYDDQGLISDEATKPMETSMTIEPHMQM